MLSATHTHTQSLLWLNGKIVANFASISTLQVVAGELLEAKGRAVQPQRVAFVRVTVLDGQASEVGSGIAGSIGDEANIVGVVTHIGVVL